jgi:hypothetical protein
MLSVGISPNLDVDTMTTIAAVAALALGVGLAFPVSAVDFEKTTWGMNLAQVRKLYPEGTVGKGEADNTIYVVYRPFGPIKAAQIVFGFPGGTLAYVKVHFPRSGGAPDPKATHYATLTKGQATEVVTSLREYLGKKHGKPSGEGLSSAADHARIFLEWEVPGTPGTSIWLKSQPLEEADELADVTLEYIDGSIYGFSKDKLPPADCSSTERTYKSLKKMERDRECAIGKTGQLTCRLDKVEGGSVKAECDKDWAFFGYEEADEPKLGMLKPGNRYLFTVRVIECSWAEIELKFVDVKPAR